MSGKLVVSFKGFGKIELKPMGLRSPTMLLSRDYLRFALRPYVPVAMCLAQVGPVCVKSVHVMSQLLFFRVIRSRKLIGGI
jgi:hypothetical protein